MYSGLADEDIQPADTLRERVAGEIDLEIGAPNDPDALADALREQDVVFTTSRLPITRSVLEAADLRVVAKIGTGVDNVDLDAARELGIPVTYTPGTNAIAVAEHTLCLLLAVLGRVVTARDALHDGHWRDILTPGTLVTGKTIGIIGYGNVGSRVGSLLAGFHTNVLAYDPYIADIDTEYAGATRTTLPDLLARSDAVVVTAELTDKTRGMLNTPEFERMPAHAVVINTARGPIIDEDALTAALTSREIAGAGLDVFETEPLPSSSSRLLDLDQVVATPHIAGVREETRERAITLLAENTLALLADEPLPDRYLAAPNPN